MLKKTAIAVAAAALMLGAVSTAQANDNDSGDYKGPSLFGPLPGQVFGHGRVRGGIYGSGIYGSAIYGRAFGYAPYSSPNDVPFFARWQWELFN